VSELIFERLTPSAREPVRTPKGIELYASMVSETGRPNTRLLAPSGMVYIPCGFRLHLHTSTYISFSFITYDTYAKYGVFSPPTLDWEDPGGVRVPFFHCGLQKVYFQDGDFLGLLLPISSFPYEVGFGPQ
jgi:hypothetical protein